MYARRNAPQAHFESDSTLLFVVFKFLHELSGSREKLPSRCLLSDAYHLVLQVSCLGRFRHDTKQCGQWLDWLIQLVVGLVILKAFSNLDDTMKSS